MLSVDSTAYGYGYGYQPTQVEKAVTSPFVQSSYAPPTNENQSAWWGNQETAEPNAYAPSVPDSYTPSAPDTYNDTYTPSAPHAYTPTTHQNDEEDEDDLGFGNTKTKKEIGRAHV